MSDSGALLLEPARQRVEIVTSDCTYREALNAFAEVAEALEEAHDLDALLHLIAKRVCELVRAKRCSIYLRDQRTARFQGQVGHPECVPDAVIKRLVAGMPADRFTNEIVESKRPVALANALSDPRPIRATMRAWNIHSVLGVPMVLDGDVVGLIFVDNEDQPLAFTPTVCEIAAAFADLAAVAIAQAQLTKELRRSVATVGRQNQLLRRAAVIDERLTALVLKGTDLEGIALAVAELTGKPTAVHDAERRPLAVATPSSLDGTVVPRLLEPGYRNHPAVTQAIGKVEATGGGLVGPLAAAGLPHRFLLVPIPVRDEVWGHLVVMEYGGRFKPLDLHVVRRAATNIALELEAERRVAAAEWDARRSLTSDLIRGDRDRVTLGRRARYQGIDLSAPRVVCLIAADDPDEAMPLAADVAAALAREAGANSVLTATVDEGVVAMLEVMTGTSARKAVGLVRDQVKVALPGLGEHVIASISTRCTEADQYARAYGEAREVLGCLRTFGARRDTRVLAADDLGPCRLLMGTSQRDDANRFAQDKLGALVNGNEAVRDLLVTLQAFFDSGRSVRRSALALGVHENTIRYRLSRIEELTGMAVGSNSSDQLSAHLALIVLSMQGQVPVSSPSL